MLCSTLDEPSRLLLTLENARRKTRFRTTLVLDASEVNEEDLCTTTR